MKTIKSLILTFVIILLLFLVIIALAHVGIPCLILKYTNLYCPACGISRMFLSIFELDFYQAFRYNPLMFIFVIFLGIFTIIEIFLFLNGKKLIYPNNKIYLFIVVIMIIYTILRNISIFSFLLPTIVN